MTQARPSVSDLRAAIVRRWPVLADRAEELANYFHAHEAVRSDHQDDLALAWACLQADRSALAELDAAILPAIEAPLRRMGCDDEAVDEIRQRVRMRLLVGHDPKLGHYRATGPLTAWVRAVAVREELQQRRKQARQAEVEGGPGAPALAGARALEPDVPSDAELDVAFARERYRTIVQTAFATALRALEPEDRELLHAHYYEGRGLEYLAQRYGLHRVSIHRRLVRIRRQLFERTRQLLREDLHARTTTIDDVVALLRSELHVSMRDLGRSRGV